MFQHLKKRENYLKLQLSAKLLDHEVFLRSVLTVLSVKSLCLCVQCLFVISVMFRAVRGRLSGSRECLYTDGGLLDQYPIHIFDGWTINILFLFYLYYCQLSYVKLNFRQHCML